MNSQLKTLGVATALIPLALVLARNPQQQGLRVFIDGRRLGVDTANAIVAPLPRSIADQNSLDAERLAGRLALVRIEGVRAASSVPMRVRGIEASDVRAFRRTNRTWERVLVRDDRTFALKAEDGAAIELGIAIVLPANSSQEKISWPTAFQVDIGGGTAESKVITAQFRAAPFIVPSALDPVDEILVVDVPSTKTIVEGLRTLTQKVGVRLTVHSGERPDVWMQDTVEFGQFAVPSASGADQFTAALTGVRKEFGFGAGALDSQIRQMLQDRQAVIVDAGKPRTQTRWIDWYGNLEATPPHIHAQRRSFPYGRILTGRQKDLAMHPGIMSFLEAQRLQWPPIVVDTSWLLIGHVDEVVNFVPAKNPAGFRVLLPSPNAARNVLDDAIRRNLGDAKVFAGTREETTVARLRESIAGSPENAAVDATIRRIHNQLKTELELDDDDFVFLPVLFDRGMAVIPNAVNSLVVNGHMIAPDPRGPRHDGKDLLAEAIRHALRRCEVQVSFIDVWDAYHARGGELHCGTNTIRRLRDPAWWKHLPNSSKNDSK
jgi:protein-arginine deiminase